MSRAEQFKNALDLAARKGMAVGYDEGFEKGGRKTNIKKKKKVV